MTKVVITDTNLTNIANAIRTKGGTSELIKPSEMATAITNLPSGNNNNAFIDTSIGYNGGNGIRTIITGIDNLDITGITNMGNFFTNCTKLTNFPQLDTSNVTNMNNMFNGCNTATTMPLYDTSCNKYAKYVPKLY